MFVGELQENSLVYVAVKGIHRHRSVKALCPCRRQPGSVRRPGVAARPGEGERLRRHPGGRGAGQHRRPGGGEERREDHTGQNDDTALQTDGGVALEKGNANTAGGLSRKAGHGDGCNGGGEVELEKPGIDG